MTQSPLAGRTALVTGGARGIGRGICLRLAREGIKVAVNYHSSESAARETAQQIEEMGSAAYTIQSLWTQAREQLNVVTILCSNRKYGILQVEFERAGIDPNAIITEKMTSLDNPPLDWVSIAKGFGVPSSRADTLDQLQIDFSRALNEPGPFLIEATI